MASPPRHVAPSEPLYKFVNGNGDETHAQALGDASRNQQFEVIHMAFDPDAPNQNQRLIVLMKRR